ncbi:MAG: hypothetical protein HY869_24520 [Chloroflexi bacterium]|nr:hypothetical protein [Chloroflexota bacterium]
MNKTTNTRLGGEYSCIRAPFVDGLPANIHDIRYRLKKQFRRKIIGSLETEWRSGEMPGSLPKI